MKSMSQPTVSQVFVLGEVCGLSYSGHSRSSRQRQRQLKLLEELTVVEGGTMAVRDLRFRRSR
jgi:uncharacterized membrane protein